MAERMAGQDPARLKLKAVDAEDLAVIAACLQDAVTRLADMTYLPRERRFAMLLNRYRWEAPPTPRGGQRIRCGVHFDCVLKAEVSGLDQDDRQQVLELLTVAEEPQQDGGSHLVLMFCGGAAVRLVAECIDCHLADLGDPWDTPRRPRHQLETVTMPKPGQ